MTEDWGDSIAIVSIVLAERRRQREKHGDQRHLPNGTGPDESLLHGMADLSTLPFDGTVNAFAANLAKRRCKAASQNEGGDGSITFEHILTEEFFEAMAEADPQALFRELVQVTAVGVQWLEKLYSEGVRP